MLRLFSAPLEMFLAVRKRRPRRRWWEREEERAGVGPAPFASPRRRSHRRNIHP